MRCKGGTALAVAAVALFLAGCSGSLWSSKEAPVDPNAYPTNFRKEILDTMQGTLTITANVRDAYISDPVMRQAGTEQRYAVCVRSNSRDIYGNYTGVTDRIAFFYGGHINQLVKATPDQCANAAYKPFPELANLCQAKSCT